MWTTRSASWSAKRWSSVLQLAERVVHIDGRARRHVDASMTSNLSPSALAIASTLDSLASRPYSMSRTVLGLGMPAFLATAYQVSCWSFLALRIAAATRFLTDGARGGSSGGNCCFAAS